MVGYLRDRTRRATTLGLILIAACGLVAALGSVLLSGTKTGAVLALAATAGPVVLYVMIVSPLTFPFGAYMMLAPFDSILNVSSAGTITRLLGILSGLAILFYMLRTKRFAEPPRSTAFWILLYLWTAASMFWAIDAPTAESLYPTALQLFGLYLVVSMFRLNLSSLRIVTFCSACGGIAAALYGLYLYHSGAAIFKERLWVRADTGWWNPDHFAGALLLPIALCLVAALWTRSFIVRVGAITGLGLMLVALVLTGARGAALGLGAMLIYLLIRDRHRITLGIMTAGLSAMALGVAGPGYLARWALAQQNGGAGRVSIWHVGWLAFKQNWLFGAGYGNFPFAYDRAFINVFESFYAQWHRASHNILLNTGVELGIIGLALLLLAWAGQFRLLRFIPETDPRYPLRLALEGALIALFVSGLFADIMIEKYVWLAFMLVVLTRNAAAPVPAVQPAAKPEIRPAVLETRLHA